MSAAPELTIGSFNVHLGRGLRSTGFAPFDVVEACRAIDTDVLVLEESWAPDGAPSDHARVAAALDMEVVVDVAMGRASVEPTARVRGRAGASTGEGGSHLAVLSRRPVERSSVTELPRLRLDNVDRYLATVDVVVGDRVLTVCGTHLPHLEFGAPLITRALRRALPPTDGAAVLIGDMNMWGWCISAMVQGGWRRVGSGRTWPAHRPHSRIDHVLVTRGVEVLATETLPDLGSDHRPIRARLRLTP